MRPPYARLELFMSLRKMRVRPGPYSIWPKSIERKASDKAEPLLLEALTIRRKAGETAEVAQSLQALGTLYGRTGRAQQAEQSFREAVSVFGKTVGGEPPDYANALEKLGLHCPSRHDYADAEPLLNRIIEIRLTEFGPEY